MRLSRAAMMLVCLPCRSSSTSFASSSWFQGRLSSGRRLVRSLDMRITPHIGAAFGFVAAFDADKRLALVRGPVIGMRRPPDKAHPTAAIGTCRAVAGAELRQVLTLQHDTSPRVKGGRN